MCQASSGGAVHLAFYIFDESLHDVIIDLSTMKLLGTRQYHYRMLLKVYSNSYSENSIMSTNVKKSKNLKNDSHQTSTSGLSKKKELATI